MGRPLLFLCVVFGIAVATTCVQVCAVPGGVVMPFCGTDGNSYKVTPGQTTCFWHCNISAVYPGTCECPNNCSSRGSCSSSCQCPPGWGGQDCSLSTQCSSSTCSGHGTCTISRADGFFLCTCFAGWTGRFCETRIPSLPQPAFPSLFPHEPVYSHHDPYGDHHPLFNQSSVHTIRIQMPATEYARMLDPQNAYNDTEATVSLLVVHSSSGNVQYTASDGVKVWIKGAASRKFAKKALKLKFAHHVSKTFFGLRELDLKCAQDDLSFIHAPLSMDFSRSLGLPVQRLGWAQLTINNVHHGLYVIQEEITEEWIRDRYQVSSSADTNMLKCGSRAELLYNGTQPSDYPKYEVKVGDQQEAVDLLVKLIQAINSTSFPSGLPLNLTRLMRYMAAEYSISDADSYTAFGNNYWLLSLDAGIPFSMLPYDQEDAYGDSIELFQIDFWASVTPYQYFLNCSFHGHHNCTPHPLTQKYYTMNGPSVNQLIKTFAQQVFGTDLVLQRIAAYSSLVNPQLVDDMWYGMDADGYSGQVSSYLDYVKLLVRYVTSKAKVMLSL